MMTNDDFGSERQHIRPPCDEELAAIQEAIEELERGELGIPFAEFDRAFRARHGIPPHG